MDELVGAAIPKSPNGASERMNGLPGKTDVKVNGRPEDRHQLITALIGRWTAIRIITSPHKSSRASRGAGYTRFL
jgi:hypothetical protein